MKLPANLVRLKQFQASQSRRQLQQLDAMIADLGRVGGEIEIQIRAAEAKAGISDSTHFAYPTFGRAARLRHDNVTTSFNDLTRQRTDAELSLAEAEAGLSMAQALEARGGVRSEMASRHRNSVIS